MSAHAYIVCRSVEDACDALAGAGERSRVIAGGTDLLLELRRPGAPLAPPLVDISRIESLRGIDASGPRVRIGPLTTHAAIAASDVIRRSAPLLAAAAAAVGSPQIRNRGTIGGNIMNAAGCADTVPALIALGAQVTLVSARGRRDLPLDGFFAEPYRTNAAQDELLVLIAFPPLPASARSIFIKLGRRSAVSIARLSVAAIVMLDDDGVVRDARIVPGAAMPVWRRCGEAEGLLVGSRPTPALLEAAGKSASAAMVAATGRRWSTEYKEPVLAVLVRRALEHCCLNPGRGTPL